MTLYPSDVINIANNIMGNRVYSAGMGGLVQQNYNNITDQAQGVEVTPVEYGSVAVVIYGLGHASLLVSDEEWNFGSYQDHDGAWWAANILNAVSNGIATVEPDGDKISPGYLWIVPEARNKKIDTAKADGEITVIYALRIPKSKWYELENKLKKEENEHTESWNVEFGYREYELSRLHRYTETKWVEYRLITQNCACWVVEMLSSVLSPEQYAVIADGNTPLKLDNRLYEDYIGNNHLTYVYEGTPYLLKWGEATLLTGD